MPEFNNMTVVAAAKIIETMSTQAQFGTLALQWGVEDYCGSGSVATKANNLAKWALSTNPQVHTPNGMQNLGRAMIEQAISATEQQLVEDLWLKLVAGLRMDGFEICEEIVQSGTNTLFGHPKETIRHVLRRMLPEDVPGLDFREAESEVVALLRKHQFTTSQGHLEQAIMSFSQGSWAAANAQFRTFYEGYLDEIAQKLGCNANVGSKQKRRFLGELSPPFLLSDYNEWDANDNKPQFVQGLMSRMHPHGSHRGLSEEEDCTFRMQITLITARLFLRRFDQRMS